MGGYLCFLNILDLGSPCFSEEGAKVQHLKACAQHREIQLPLSSRQVPAHMGLHGQHCDPTKRHRDPSLGKMRGQ